MNDNKPTIHNEEKMMKVKIMSEIEAVSAEIDFKLRTIQLKIDIHPFNKYQPHPPEMFLRLPMSPQLMEVFGKMLEPHIKLALEDEDTR